MKIYLGVGLSLPHSRVQVRRGAPTCLSYIHVVVRPKLLRLLGLQAPKP